MQSVVLLLAAGGGVSALPPLTATTMPAPQGGGAKTDDNLVKKTDKYAFELSLKEFGEVALKKEPGLDWSTDGCTKPAPQNPLGFPFEKACRRHDFGYRNFANQGRMDKATRKKVDQRFRDDLKETCAEQTKGSHAVCKAVAETYYAGVRMFGGSHVKKPSKDGKGIEARDVVDEDAYAEYLYRKAISDALVAEVLARRTDIMVEGDEVGIRW